MVWVVMMSMPGKNQKRKEGSKVWDEMYGIGCFQK